MCLLISEYVDNFIKNLQYRISRTFLPAGVDVFHTERRSDMTKLLMHFINDGPKYKVVQI